MATTSVRSIRINQITGNVISAAMRVHSLLGPGLLESAYRACLAHELNKRGMNVASEVGLPVVYDGEKIELGHRIDLIVEGSVIVEIKCVEAVHPVHQAQLLSAEFLCDPPPRRNQAHGRRQRLGKVKFYPVFLCVLRGKGLSSYLRSPPS